MTKSQRIRNYINFRYPNWMDYACYKAKQHGFEGWEGDLLNDTIISLLEKDEDKLIKMLNKKTRKKVNGQPTTELDKFVLKIMNMNAFSQVAPFRKNTLGKKIISRRSGEVRVAQTEPVDTIGNIAEDRYPSETDQQIEDMHHRNIKRLKQNGFGQEAVKYYQKHFVDQRSTDGLRAREREKVERIKLFLVETPKTILER